VLLRSTQRDGSIIGTPGAAGKLQDAGNTAEGLAAASCPRHESATPAPRHPWRPARHRRSGRRR
jgi:hypothetical protein